MKWAKKTVLAEIETTYGTDPVPTVGANALVAYDVELTPLVAEYDEYQRASGRIGDSVHVLAKKGIGIRFKIPFVGSGTATTPPGFAAVYRACGVAETIEVDAVDYLPIESLEESMTLYINIDTQLHKLVGVRGNLKVSGTSGKVPMSEFTGMALYAAPVEQSQTAVTFTNQPKPLAMNAANTLAAIGAVNVSAHSFSFDMGNEVQHRDLTGVEEIVITDRKPRASMSILAPSVATRNFWAEQTGETLQRYAVNHGPIGARASVVSWGDSAQIIDTKYGNQDGTAMLNIDFALTAEFEYLFKLRNH